MGPPEAAAEAPCPGGPNARAKTQGQNAAAAQAPWRRQGHAAAAWQPPSWQAQPEGPNALAAMQGHNGPNVPGDHGVRAPPQLLAAPLSLCAPRARDVLPPKEEAREPVENIWRWRPLANAGGFWGAGLSG